MRPLHFTIPVLLIALVASSAGIVTPPPGQEGPSGESLYDIYCAVSSGMTDAWGSPIRATDLTEPWTFRGGATPADIIMRLKTGLDGTPMPSYDGSAPDRDLWDLSGYLLSITRKAVWDMDSAGVVAFCAGKKQEAVSDPVGRGALPFVMPYTGYANLSPEDLDALVAYLRTVPPVLNKFPDPEGLNEHESFFGMDYAIHR
ncbi:MAG TPA: cytochrome c [Bacteroidota bacterium]|nr:cytochrome c [Bacteroidota bacterium]